VLLNKNNGAATLSMLGTSINHAESQANGQSMQETQSGMSYENDVDESSVFDNKNSSVSSPKSYKSPTAPDPPILNFGTASRSYDNYGRKLLIVLVN
jgi:hypothetical protein